MKIFYKTEATAVGGRSGHTKLADGSLGFDLVAFNEQGKQGTNPEQLFALGYAACFDSAMSLVAKQLSLNPTSAKTSVAVGIGQKSTGAYALDVDITVHLAGLSAKDAQKLAEASHAVCPYSNATRGNIEARLHVNVVE